MNDKPALRPVGTNPVRLWGMTSAERLRRIGKAQGNPADGGQGVLLANLGYAFDPAWLRTVSARPGMAVTREGVPVLVHATDEGGATEAERAREAGTPLPSGYDVVPQEAAGALVNNELRKRERPFMERLTADSVRPLERASYFGAYKGVTDLLTKYLWPEWALVLTRLCARAGITPNQVTAVGALLCVLATVTFWYGCYWLGMALGLGFMVLDTVDGKLARCTITSSPIGNILDHGIDLVHPPFWWYAWGVGLHAYGRPLSPDAFLWTMVAIVGGYVAQRLVEGIFMRRYGMHIHVWRPFDSRFRLITARRNPNMVILFASVILFRPDWGLVAVAVWTILSLVVHVVQLAQALAAEARGRPVRSWIS